MTIFKRAGKQYLTYLANYSFPFNIMTILALENVETLNPLLKFGKTTNTIIFIGHIMQVMNKLR